MGILQLRPKRDWKEKHRKRPSILYNLTGPRKSGQGTAPFYRHME